MMVIDAAGISIFRYYGKLDNGHYYTIIKYQIVKMYISIS